MSALGFTLTDNQGTVCSYIIAVNEGDWRQPNFQHTFWGTNYPRLLAIKKKYDPDNFFYATVGVGSEAWVVAKDGRMCAAKGPKDPRE